jgi:anti-sigma factor RsiW
VGYFVDRPAAVFVYTRRQHTVSLLVFRAGGLALPPRALARPVRGFNVLLWRDGELGYALASDLEAGELATLATRLSP